MGLKPFESRLLGVLLAFLAVQTLGFAVFQAVFPIPSPWDWAFYPLTAAYHGLIWFGLWSIRGHFENLEGRPLQRIGLPNLLTLFRLTSLPIITLVFFLARTEAALALPLVIFVSAAFLTDLLDGFLARAFGLGTRLGKLLDSSTDYIILFSLTLVLGISGVLPVYLLVLILLRFLTQVAAVLWVQIRWQRQWVETTWLGKLSLFVLMVLFAVEILLFLKMPGMEGHWAVRTLEVFTAGAMVVSTIDKVAFFYRKLRSERLI